LQYDCNLLDGQKVVFGVVLFIIIKQEFAFLLGGWEGSQSKRDRASDSTLQPTAIEEK